MRVILQATSKVLHYYEISYGCSLNWVFLMFLQMDAWTFHCFLVVKNIYNAKILAGFYNRMQLKFEVHV